MAERKKRRLKKRKYKNSPSHLEEYENFWKKNYSYSWNYIKDSRKFIYAIIWIFVLFVILGAFVPVPASITLEINAFIKQLLGQTEGLSWFGLIKFIFFNNIQTSFSGMIFGFFLGIYSVATTLINGYVVGFVALLAVKEEGLTVLWRLFPHGIFELPALFISLGLGLKFGTFIFQKNKMKSFQEYLINSLRVFVFVIIPLLLIAAIIEGTLIFFVG